MNYLAHLYLSGSDKELVLGNFVGDFIKGRNFKQFSPKVQEGIRLHRTIDSFTDSHPLIKEGNKRLYSSYHKYAGVIMDIFYDHFLAINWKLYHDKKTLEEFASSMHHILVRNYLKLPNEAKKIVPFLIQSKRLVSYGTLDGIERTLIIMTKHTSLPDQTNAAMECMDRYYDDLNEEFQAFFKDMIQLVQTEHQVKLPVPDDSDLVSGK